MNDAAPGIAHTALVCLVEVARFHRLDLSVPRLVHDFALGPGEVSTAKLVSIARRSGLDARSVRLQWRDFPAIKDSLPCLARLNDGRTVIVVGVRPGASGHEIGVLDPLVPGEILTFDEQRFRSDWAGEAVLVKRRYRITSPDQPFGLRWFVPEILRQRGLFANVGLAAVMLHALALAVPIFFQLVIDKVLVHQSVSTLYVLVAGILIALAFDAVFSFLRRYILLYASNRLDIRVATRTFAHLLRLPIAFFDQASAGVLVKHMQQGQRVREFLTGRLFLTLLDALALVVFLPVLLLYSLPLTGIVLIFALCTAAVIGMLLAPFRTRLRDLYEAEGSRQALLVEAIHGMRTVKSLALESVQRAEWDRRAAFAATTQFRVGSISTFAQSAVGLLEKLMTVAVIGFGAQMVFDGTLTVGALVAFQMLAGRVAAPLVQLVSLVHEYQETALSARMLGEVMNRAPEFGETARGARPPIAGKIEFSRVQFAYVPGTPALAEVSFAIPARSIFGIVGRSGSGKTTIARLIQGLYWAQSGTVRIDGIDAREIDLAYLRSNIGVVLQDNFLFRGTVLENVAATRPGAPIEDVMRAIRAAGADEFIERLPRGLDTKLDENGANLSGGQKQRLAIARALVRQPPILVLDEATSALDPESEALLQDNLMRIAEGRTLIMISHRLSMLKPADNILVLDAGRVVGLGPHDGLLQTCELYAQLWRQQTRHFR